MPAIITDQFRILNAETFVKSFVGIGTTGNNNFYTFLAHPDPQFTGVANYGTINWNTTPPDPRDSFQQESVYWDSMLFLKKVQQSDVTRVIPRIDWKAGTTYEMYRGSYDGDDLSPISGSTTLYGSNFYVMNSEFRVYVCINNGANPNSNGEKSLYEPKFIDEQTPQAAGDDGYLWKYMFTISPSDIVKFATAKYIPLPKTWGDNTTAIIKSAAVPGKLETIVIKNFGNNYAVDGNNDKTISDISIDGDGTGALCEVGLNGGKISSVTVTNGGSGYTWARLRFEKDRSGTVETGGGQGTGSVTAGSGAEFEVIVPPPGGHGADVYKELGGYRVMVYSKYENNVDDKADYITDNSFSRVGIVRNPLRYDSTELLNSTTATALGALKLTGVGVSEAIFTNNTKITQTVGLGQTAVAHVASWDKNTSVLKYYQPVGYSTLSAYSYDLHEFISSDESSATIEGGSISNALKTDVDFSSDAITINNKVVNLGQSFTGGVAPPDVKKYSGEIIYIDNRAAITRSDSQKEEVKIVVEF